MCETIINNLECQGNDYMAKRELLHFVAKMRYDFEIMDLNDQGNYYKLG